MLVTAFAAVEALPDSLLTPLLQLQSAVGRGKPIWLLVALMNPPAHVRQPLGVRAWATASSGIIAKGCKCYSRPLPLLKLPDSLLTPRRRCCSCSRSALAKSPPGKRGVWGVEFSPAFHGSRAYPRGIQSGVCTSVHVLPLLSPLSTHQPLSALEALEALDSSSRSPR